MGGKNLSEKCERRKAVLNRRARSILLEYPFKSGIELGRGFALIGLDPAVGERKGPRPREVTVGYEAADPRHLLVEVGEGLQDDVALGEIGKYDVVLPVEKVILAVSQVCKGTPVDVEPDGLASAEDVGLLDKTPQRIPQRLLFEGLGAGFEVRLVEAHLEYAIAIALVKQVRKPGEEFFVTD